MTLSNSERFRRFLQLDTTIDRTPVIEWAGWGDKTIARWQEEDLPVIDDYADGINDYWGQDLLHQYWCPIRGAGMPGAAYHGGPIILDEKDYEKVHRRSAGRTAPKHPGNPEGEGGSGSGVLVHPGRLFLVSPYSFRY